MNVPLSNNIVRFSQGAYRMEAYLQPIVSVARQQIIGFEGLSRGFDPVTGESMPVLDLFEQAQRNNNLFAFDHDCRERCMQQFNRLEDRSNSWHLFANIDATVLDHIDNLQFLYGQTLRNGLLPQQVVIEVNEHQLERLESLQQFTDHYKRLGFLIAVDDVGTGYSNLERLSAVRPDIVKLDRSLLIGIEDSYYKQEIFHSMVHMSAKLGAIVVAEGVETVEQACFAMEFGAHLLQGYLFSRPQAVEELNLEEVDGRMRENAQFFTEHIQGKITRERQCMQTVGRMVDRLCRRLGKVEPEQYDEVLGSYQWQGCAGLVECAYVINRAGLQVSGTVFANEQGDRHRNMMFFPATKGANHELKPFYYELMNAGVPRHVSSAYISHASGNVCVTYAYVFFSPLGEGFVLCVDALQSGLEQRLM